MVTDCPKFIPNIFNNAKCSSCFKTREEHGDVSLDSKSLRRVIKCGYLFIAPRDWDFCNPSAHRTKRWQRRWFVLYSDDQLTWSIDEHPDTIPQGSLDMREILEVKNAEDITENQHSLALTGKSTTFIKGVNKEDIASWTGILTKYGNKVLTTAGGKRSLTLPGGFGSGTATTRFETGVVIGPSRQRFHSVTTPPNVSGLTSPISVGGSTYGKCFVESPPSSPSSNKIVKTSSSSNSSPYISSISTSSSSSSMTVSTSSSNEIVQRNNNTNLSSSSRHQLQPHHRLILQQQQQQQQASRSNQNHHQRNHDNQGHSSDIRHHASSESSASPQSSQSSYTKCFDSSTDVTDSVHYSPCSTNSVRALRGDPDGCGGLDVSDGGPLRKGWLLKQVNNEWLKHWFVLRNNQLIYYENSEELNPLGTIEITEETSIKQFDSSRHYGFEIMNKANVNKLSAITNGMRGIWMKALESAKVKVREQRDSVEIIQPPPPTQIANPPSPPLKSKKSRWRKKSDLKLFDSLKDEFAERERELDSLRSGTELSRGESPRMREILKSQAVQIDNFRTQLSSGFMEIEKLEMFCKSREAEYAESLKCKDEIIEEIRDQLTREISVREKIELQSHELDRQVQLLSEKVSQVQSLLSETERELDISHLNNRELRKISEGQQAQLRQELELLCSRCNDLTEKLYQSEKTAKTLKTKLGRVKSQSLKDRQIESDVISKIHDLEEKISRFDKPPMSPSSTTSGASLSLPPSASLPTSPIEGTPSSTATTPTTGGRDGGIINVIMKLNDLDQRVEKVTESLWFRRGELEEFVGGECQNCKLLELEVRERDERLEVLEGNLKKLEMEFDKKMQELREFVKEQPPAPQETSPTFQQSSNKYQIEIEQLRNLCAKGLEAMENSHRRMIMELEEKHRRELQNLRIEKEQELAEETKATLSALDAMRKNHQLELQREMSKFKEDFMRKFQCNQDLTDLHKEHEEELHEVKTEILRLTEKYSLKCVEASKLEDTISFLKTQLNEAKRRIIEMETNDFQTSISSATKKPDQVTALRSRLEQLILSRPLEETSSTKAEDQSSSAASGASSPISPTIGHSTASGGFNSSSKRTRHSIIRSPSCPKLTANSRLTVLQ